MWGLIRDLKVAEHKLNQLDDELCKKARNGDRIGAQHCCRRRRGSNRMLPDWVGSHLSSSVRWNGVLYGDALSCVTMRWL